MIKARTVKKHLHQIASSIVTGKPIMGGAFFMHDTVGLPLGMQLHQATNLGVTISIPAFVEDARVAGWSDGQIRKLIKAELVDSGRHADVQLVLDALGKHCGI